MTAPAPGPTAEQLDLHHPPRVVAAAHDARLLEHPDEDARVVVAGRELAGSTVPPSSRTALYTRRSSSGPRDVADREAPDRCRIGGARKEHRVARFAVPAAAAHHLHVALE